jgi:hypothetical protein
MEEMTMKLAILTRRGASTLAISAALAAAALAPARAADTPCTAQNKAGDNAASSPMSGSTADSSKTVPDGFGRQVVPQYGTTAPGTPSQLSADKKKGEQTADAGAKASDPACK